MIQELIYELKVKDVMQGDVIKVYASTPMQELRDVLRDNRISGVPVVENDRLVGIVSMEDFIKWLTAGARKCLVKEHMTTDVVTTFEDEPLVQAVNKLERLGFGRLPVISRKTGALTGVITKGDIIAGMLKKLDIGIRQAETRLSHDRDIFRDIIADEKAFILEYRVEGGEFGNAGNSAGGLKKTLLNLGIAPKIVRRVAIATYEAEMNLIFYADGGSIESRIEPGVIRIEIKDEGPGIPDVEQAMKPGYSTAPDWVRELGFGAGMGLNNIQNCSDSMAIDSRVGEGTRLKLEILLGDKDDSARDYTEASA